MQHSVPPRQSQLLFLSSPFVQVPRWVALLGPARNFDKRRGEEKELGFFKEDDSLKRALLAKREATQQKKIDKHFPL